MHLGYMVPLEGPTDSSHTSLWKTRFQKLHTWVEILFLQGSVDLQRANYPMGFSECENFLHHKD